MEPGTRVRMRDIGGQWIKGTVQGPGRTTEVRPLNSPGEDIPTVRVKWDEEFRGTNDVVPDTLEELTGEDAANS